mmetsp:Transcript_32850/g.65373  ORF Transcript_32850/g.65373 Transcript_32850/m.65373 type:complete len:84 (-) Transcript_32850:329-580(-)
MQRFGLATTFAARLLSAELPADAKGRETAAKDARTLLRDMHRRVTEVKRSNRRLAKELSEWVQLAMQTSGVELEGAQDALPLT